MQTKTLVTASPRAAVDLATALDAELAARGHDLAVWSVRDRLITLLATVPGSEATLAATRVAARPAHGVSSPDHARRIAAAHVAATRPPAELLALLSDDEQLRSTDPEFGLLLLHELVIRGESVSDAADLFVQWAHTEDHPLVVLPTELTDIESELPRWLPRHPGSQRVDPPWPQVIRRATAPLGNLVAGVGRRTSHGPRQAAAVFEDWVRNSNGQVEVATFPVGEGFAAAAGAPPALRADRTARRVSAAEVCVRLLAAASGGGAYSRGLGGAFARLAMWEALAGFVGLPWPTPLDDVRVAAQSARWIAVDLSDDWFYDVFWDEWLIAVFDGQLTVVAATDTD